MLEINKLTRLDLGVKDENKARDLFIDMNAWYKEYPNGTFSIWHKRNGDQTKYAASGVTFDRETGILKWTPDAYDTYYKGRGLAEFRVTENDVIKKTKDILTDVEKSMVLPSGETLTSGWQNFLNQIESDKNTVMQAVGQIGDNVEKSEAWATGKKNGEDVPDTDPTYHNNSKYYAGQAAGSATTAGNAKDAAVEAKGKAEDAQAAAEAARDKYPQIDDSTKNWKIWDPEDEQYEVTEYPSRGPQGETGPTGPGVPAGGTTGQILTKKSDTDLDTEWQNAPDPTGKADKVTGATNGNLAGLDGSGNLTDSGKNASDFVASNQGAGNAGKALGIANDGSVTPVPFSGDDFTGATAGAAGVHGYVPAPAAGDQGKVLMGGGSWSGELPERIAELENVSTKRDLTILAADWTLSGGVYTYTWTDALVTASCDYIVQIKDGAEASEIDEIETAKVTGGIQFTSAEQPQGSLPVTIKIIKTKNTELLSLDASQVTSDAVSGTNNVEDALSSLNSNITTKYPSGHPNLRKSGNVVSIDCTNESIASLIAYTIPEEYRPPNNCRAAALIRNTSYGNSRLGIVNIATTGAITVYEAPIGGEVASVTTGAIDFSLTWIK